MEKSEHLCIVGCDIKWYSCCQKQYGIFLKKLNTEFPRYPAVSFLGIYPKELKAGSQRYISTHMFTAVLFKIDEMVEATTQVSIEGWVDKQNGL